MATRAGSVELKWTCIKPGHHQSHCGRYSIERMRPEFLNPHPWTVTMPDDRGGEVDTLAEAKVYCQRHENRLFPPPPSAPPIPITPEERAARWQRLKDYEAAEAKRRRKQLLL